MTSILEPNQINMAKAVALLTAGKCIGMPTETVYGLAANAYDEPAVLQTFAIKARPLFDPLIVHVKEEFGSLRALDQEQVINSSRMDFREQQTVTELMQSFWPGPLTIVLPKGRAIGDFVSSGLKTVAVRMPSHKVALALLNQLPFPLSAPSANRFGRVSPTRAQDVAEEFGDAIELILDGGPCEMGVESTVIQVQPSGQILMLRPGSLSREALEKCVGRPVQILDKGKSVLVGASPGLLENHYAPAIPLLFLDSADAERLMKEGEQFLGAPLPVAFLWSSDGVRNQHADSLQNKRLTVRVELVLSSSGDSVEAARNLFQRLRQAEKSGAKLILCDRLGFKIGLWIAVEDRLQKAAFKGSFPELLRRLQTPSKADS